MRIIKNTHNYLVVVYNDYTFVYKKNGSESFVYRYMVPSWVSARMDEVSFNFDITSFVL